MENIIIKNYEDKDLYNYVNFFNFIAKELNSGTTSEEDVKIYFQDSRMDPYKNMFVAYKEDKFIGFTRIYLDFKKDIKKVESRLIVHPKYRRKGIGTNLLKTILNRCNKLNINIMDVYTLKDSEAAREFAKKHKFKIERYSFKMRKENLKNIEKVKIPNGITFDKLNFEKYSLKDLTDIDNETFKDHWGFMEVNEDDWERETKSSYFLENGIIFAKDREEIVGFSYAEFDEEDIKKRGERVGYIYMLGVKKDYRRKGIGKALLLSSIKFLKKHRVDIAELGVDAENPNKAKHLYESVGFREKSRAVCFRKHLK